MREEPLFKPGDVAVLKHQTGGRVFTVHSVNGEKVTEKAWCENQQPYALEVWVDQLVAVRDAAAAQVLTELLGATNDKYEAEVRKIIALRQQEFDALYAAGDHRRQGG